MAYRLDLSSHAALCNTHLVFHASLLQPLCSNGLHDTAPPVDVDDKVEYKVHHIKPYCMHHDEL